LAGRGRWWWTGRPRSAWFCAGGRAFCVPARAQPALPCNQHVWEQASAAPLLAPPPPAPHLPLQAAEALYVGSPVAGQAFFVTNQEPVPFWAFTGDILEGLGYRRAPAARARARAVCVALCLSVCPSLCVECVCV
jgi:hypothetical protein